MENIKKSFETYHLTIKHFKNSFRIKTFSLKDFLKTSFISKREINELLSFKNGYK